jgi:hypothetical protein
MATPIDSLRDAFSQIDDPRKPRGVRHPYSSLLSLVFLGLLCRQTELAALQRWAEDHWETLRGALGFTREHAPHATTMSRALARFSLEQFRGAFARWISSQPGSSQIFAAAADGKTSKQGHDADGDPIHMLNIFAHDLNICLAQFPVCEGKPTEPQALKEALGDLLVRYPSLRLFTGDALFAQRPLARVLLQAGRDFLFAVKENQPDLLEAIEAGFRDTSRRTPDAQTIDKQGARSRSGGCISSTATRSPTSGMRPGFPVSS